MTEIPINAQKLPAGQGVVAESPVVAQSDPTPQLAQLAWHAACWYNPAPQLVHAIAEAAEY